MEMIKRISILCFILLLCFSITTFSTFAQKIFEPMDVSWAAGPTGGVTYPLGAQALELISNKLAPGSRTTVVEGAAGSNVELVNRGEVQLGHTMGDTAFAAVLGREPFTEKKENFSVWGRVMDFEFQFVVLKSLNVKSFEEIKEKKIPIRVGTNVVGSAAEVITRLVLNLYGITYEDIKSWGGNVVYTGFGDGVLLMQDGHLDAWGAISATPTPFVEEMSMSRDIVILPVRKDIREELITNYGFAEGSVSAGTYSNINEDIETVVSPMVLIANNDVPVDFMYSLTEMVTSPEFAQDLSSIHPKYGLITPENACKGLNLPFHEGAKKFYEEKGFLIGEK